MIKYGKIINDTTKECAIGLGDKEDFYRELGFKHLDVELAYNGNWYLTGYAPAEPEKSYVQKRQAEYPDLGEQLDMIYWDKVNGTNTWQSKIAEIKAKYPKA